LNCRQSVLDAVVQLVEKQALQFLGLFQLGEISARPGNRHRLSLQTITFEFNKAPRAQPSPTAIELFYRYSTS
jgi:hypothetical protein